MSSRFSRRDFIKSAALAAGAIALGACTKTVKETVIQEKEVTREVTKVVETVITPTPAPAPLTLVWMRADSECAQWSLTRDTPLLFEWTEEATGIHMSFDVVPQADYEQVFNLRAAAGDIKADLVQMQGSSDASYLARAFSDGVIVSMNDLLEANGQNMLALFKEYPEYKQDLSLPTGEFLAIGAATTSPYEMRVWSIRQDWLDKLGLSMPGTLEEISSVAQSFATKDPNGNGKADEAGMLSPDGLWGLIVMTGQAYGLVGMVDGWHVKDGKVINDWIDPHFYDVFTFLNDCVKKGAVPPDYDDASLNFGSVMSRAVNGQVGLWVRAPLVLPALLDWSGYDMQKTDPTARWVNTPLPPTAEGLTVADVEPVATRWRTYGITKQSKEPAAAMRWLDYVFASKEGRDIWSYGIEGQTYERNADGTVKMLVESENDAVKSGPLAGRWWGGCITMPLITDAGSTERGLVTWNAPDWCMKTVSALLPAGRRSTQTPILPPDSASRVATLMTDVKTYKNEMWAKFVAGDTALSTASFDEYVSTLEKLGLAEVRQLFQAATSA
jgi:putative aldouronate transport system substrate-binding protein